MMQKRKPQTFDIDFPGGDLMTLMETIKKQNGIMPNVIINDEVRGTGIPPFSLASVEFSELVEALGTLDIGLHIDGPTENVFTIIKNVPEKPGIVEIYSLRRLLNPEGLLRLKMDDIATAIRTAWDMIPNPGDPNMKVHQETGLLIVQASKDEQGVVKTVIGTLLDQWDEAERDLVIKHDNQTRKMGAEYEEELEKLKAAHQQELAQKQRLFEMELKGHDNELRSLRDRYEKLMAEYESLKRGNQ
jgi:hypothetical protein